MYKQTGVEDKERFRISHVHESSNVFGQQLSIGNLNAWIQQDDGIPVSYAQRRNYGISTKPDEIHRMKRLL